MEVHKMAAWITIPLWDPMDCSLLGSSTYGIFQARILEWVAISFSRRSSQPRDWTWVSRIVGRRFTVWATRKVPAVLLLWVNSQTRNVFLRHYSQVELLVKGTPANAGDPRDMGLISESGRSPGGGHGNPLQYSCPGNPMDRGAWLATVHRIT